MGATDRETKVDGFREGKADESKATPVEAAIVKSDPEPKPTEVSKAPKKASKSKSAKKKPKSKAKRSKAKRSKAVIESESEDEDEDETDSDSDSSTSSSGTQDSESESESESDSEHLPKSKRRKRPYHKSKLKKRSSRIVDSDSEESQSSGQDSDLSSGSDEDEDVENRKGSLHRLERKLAHLEGQLGGGGGGNFDRGLQFDDPLLALRSTMPPHLRHDRRGRMPILDLGNRRNGLDQTGRRSDWKRRDRQKQKGRRRKHKEEDGQYGYKRVDQVWDYSINNYKLQDTTESTSDAQYEEFLFHIRRNFDWDGKHKDTCVDIKSKLLRESLQKVMGNVKGISLVEETPSLDPNLLFLYLEDMREHLSTLKHEKPAGSGKKQRRKQAKRLQEKRKQLKILVKYVDKDYAAVKKSLYPMLENGIITFDLLWALWKPNTLAYTGTYGSQDEPRVFKVETAEKVHSIINGDMYFIEGKYFEYDGKRFGFGNMMENISQFRGTRKITSLGAYPFEYVKDKDQVREQLISRGKDFVSLAGVHFKNHQGMAYYKKKKSVIKVNINGRVMIDGSTHRRINPNYPVSLVLPKDQDLISDEEFGCECESEEDEEGGDNDDGDIVALSSDEEMKVSYVTKVYQDAKGKTFTVRVRKDEVSEEELGGRLELVEGKASEDEGEKKDKKKDKGKGKGKRKEKETKKEGKDGGSDNDYDNDTDTDTDNNGKKEVKGKELPKFSDEEYLIASPVVLGFAFAEKLWLEFTVSGVKEIQWNQQAYESLVLEPQRKAIVKALVESHKYHAAESIDDVIQGKGKGLVAVLHGPPGTGKTLTAEGISELLKCPLYMVSAGELGTDSRFLEAELQKILDICHAWGAILLLDEADVFLEKRNMHDIHRNALVSIFLRQLEYFQGILFLTTNRVETFDDAIQSRIHIALRYDSLELKAKRTIFKIFIERVRVLEKLETMPFTEEDYTSVAKFDLNGRQIKNTVRTAQALAVNKGEPLSMKHIKQVLEVLTSFDRDLKGGTGYQEAMMSYV